MSDIDFDEIDRAVNSAVGDDGVAGNDTLPKAPDFSADNRNDNNNVSSQSQNSNPISAVRRSGGRFMDIVHPSSDMRSSNASPMLTRSNPVVKPLRPSTETSEVVNSAQTEYAPPKPAFPDPIDLASNQTFEENDEPTDQEASSKDNAMENVFTENAPADPAPEIMNAIDSEPEASNDEGSQLNPAVNPPERYTSPFLENTEVEKRPLGAHNDLTSTAEPHEAIEPAVTAVSGDEPSGEQQPEVKAAETYAEEIPKEESYVANEESVSTPVNTSVETETGRPNMITPQYHPEPVEPPQDASQSSPYDAAAYEPPAPKKKTRVWLWIGLGILLVLVGAVAGAYLYLSNLL